MLAEDSSIWEVDPRVWIRDAVCSGKYFHLSILIYPFKDVLVLAIILFGKHDHLGCVEKAVFFSHQHQLITDFYLNMSGVKFCHLGDDQSVYAASPTDVKDLVPWVHPRWLGGLA